MPNGALSFEKEKQQSWNDFVSIRDMVALQERVAILLRKSVMHMTTNVVWRRRKEYWCTNRSTNANVQRSPAEGKAQSINRRTMFSFHPCCCLPCHRHALKEASTCTCT